MECDLTKATILQTFDDDAQAISYVRMKAHPLLEDAKDVPKAFQVCNEPVELQHEEHDTVELPPGNYVVKIVREFNHITRRAQYVAD